MEAEKSLKITTRRQFEEMVSFMVKNEAIAKGLKFAENSCVDKATFDGKWNLLVSKLNSLGPPLRNAVGWQKVWSDYKLKLRKKLAHNKKEMNSTGGAPLRLAHLSALEEQVSDLLHLHRTAQSNAVMYSVDEAIQFEYLNNSEKAEQMVTTVPVDTAKQVEEVEPAVLQSAQLQHLTPERYDPGRRERKRHGQNDDIKLEMLNEQTKSLSEIPKLLEKSNKFLQNISNTMEKKYNIYKKMQQKKEQEIDLRMKIMKLKLQKLQRDM